MKGLCQPPTFQMLAGCDKWALYATTKPVSEHTNQRLNPTWRIRKTSYSHVRRESVQIISTTGRSGSYPAADDS